MQGVVFFGIEKKKKFVKIFWANFFFQKQYMPKVAGADQRQVKQMIKKFLEIRDLLPEKNRDLMKYPYLKLVELIQNKFGSLITKAAFDKYKRERTDLTNEQILSYIERYVDLYDRLEANTPPIMMMSFDDYKYITFLQKTKHFTPTKKK